MATDYDAPRHPTEDAEAAETIGAVASRHAAAREGLAAEPDAFETGLGALDADLAGDDLTVTVLPRQENEFTCSNCFLVHHRSQLVDAKKMICRDCA